MNRATIIVLDGVGIGELPDAGLYGDVGSNTLANTAKVSPLRLPNLQKMGLGNIAAIPGIPPVPEPTASYGKAMERSPGKDTTTGHWEIAGIVLSQPFPTYPAGFPEEILEQFCEATGRGYLENKTASGTEIINRLGEEHQKTGKWIVYTSADSVFQIAAHEDTVPLEELYEACRKAREILKGEHAVGRIIARPFVGTPGNYVRAQAHRHDYSLIPTQDTLLDFAKQNGHEVIGIGKINDIYSGQGLTESHPTGSNEEGIEKTIEKMRSAADGSLIFTNLVDFDSRYGHRNDPRGMARALEAFDENLPRIVAEMRRGDLLLITADHGCDPTMPGTDHSREHIPLLVYRHGERNESLGVRNSFSDIAATLAEGWGMETGLTGESFWKVLSSTALV
ncbi:MAG TPA: phosphopentomutase [Cyanobacteria bacterium UBA8530]|nr:phosphopentomutase [Cyanobacteria bacterium UBA8530]